MAELRPECWDFAMSFLGEPEASAITEYVEGLEIALAAAEALAQKGRAAHWFKQWGESQAQLAQARAAYVEMRSFLENYGQHHGWCDSRGRSKSFRSCNCGLAAALAEQP